MKKPMTYERLMARRGTDLLDYYQKAWEDPATKEEYSQLLDTLTYSQLEDLLWHGVEVFDRVVPCCVHCGSQSYSSTGICPCCRKRRRSQQPLGN
jgi:hypothetical protein